MKNLLSEIKKSIVFIGRTANEDIFSATGFLVLIEEVFHIITAKHVIFNSSTNRFVDDNFWVALNTKNKGMVKKSFNSIKNDCGISWIFHSDPSVDLAVLPIPLDFNNEDIKVIPENLFFDVMELSELTDVFFLSFQPGVPTKSVQPIIRSGSVSRINDDHTFYIDGSVFPGNSGSPVFVKPSPVRYDSSGGISLGGDAIGGKFLGVIGSYIPYQEVAISQQTGRPRVIFEENTGLSVIWSITRLKEIFLSPEFKDQINRLKPKN